jgi:hypothetical protein
VARRHSRLPLTPPCRLCGTPAWREAGVSALPGSSLQIPWGIPLRSNPNERRCASAFLTTKTDVADEGVPADASAAQEQREREVRDPPATARQAEERVALVHRLPDTPGSPVGVGFHGGIIAQKSG